MRIPSLLIALGFAAALAGLGCAPPATALSPTAVTRNFTVASESFQSGETIPSRLTCAGANVSPQLWWNGEPAKTAAFALILDDPDAPSGVFTHWVAFDIPPSVHAFAEDVPKIEHLDNGAVQGRNDARGIGYTGPCPPPQRITIVSRSLRWTRS